MKASHPDLDLARPRDAVLREGLTLRPGVAHVTWCIPIRDVTIHFHHCGVVAPAPPLVIRAVGDALVCAWRNDVELFP